MDIHIVQAFFMLGFVAMAAGALWFYLERNDLKPELRSVATYAAVIAFIAAIMYYVMKDVVLFPGGKATPADIEATLPLRYIDW
ncbi:MAG: bacteriorhodopsin, partial [Microcella pacifica]